VTLAGVIPDLMALDSSPRSQRGIPTAIDLVSDYHHLLGHNLGFGLLVMAAGALWRPSAVWRQRSLA